MNNTFCFKALIKLYIHPHGLFTLKAQPVIDLHPALQTQITGELTDGGEDVGEAEVVDGVERQQVEEELLLLLLTAQEGVTLVQLSAGQSTRPPGQVRWESHQREVPVCHSRSLLHSQQVEAVSAFQLGRAE